MKKFFGITDSYKFEWNDLRALVTVVNVILVMRYGLSIAWFGLAVAGLGLIRDFCADRHLNGIIMHFASFALNTFFLLSA